MEHQENQGLLTRRSMLKSIGLAGAAAITSPLTHAGESAAKAAILPSLSGVKVGLLLPASRFP